MADIMQFPPLKKYKALMYKAPEVPKARDQKILNKLFSLLKKQ